MKKSQTTIHDYNLKFKNLTHFDQAKINKVIVHCSATDAPHSVKDVHKWHLDRGWSGCGYHYFVRKSGDIEIGRPFNMIGSHCKGQNSYSIGVCFEGLKEFKPNQIKVFPKLARHIMIKLDRLNMPFIPHNYFNSDKECPNLHVPSVFEGEIKIGKYKSRTVLKYL